MTVPRLLGLLSVLLLSTLAATASAAERAEKRTRSQSAERAEKSAKVPRAAERAEKSRKTELELSIESPEPGALIGDPAGRAFVAGKALALFGDFQTFDIVFVIDTSESTAAPSGADVDGDGQVGARRGERWLTIFGKVLPIGNSDGGDSVLAAEVAAVRVLINQLDPRSTRVGVVSFSGDNDPMTPDSYTVVPLTTEYDKVRRSLDELVRRGPGGMTHMAAGVNRGMVELLGSHSAYSEKREGSRRIIIFLTDGTPTLPFTGSPAQNARTAITKAKRAARAGIRIDTYAIGEEALAEPVVAVEMAQVTNGIFTPVRNPKDLRAVFEEVSFAEIERLEITNRTTGARAEQQIQNADGSFAALVPVLEGVNELEVFARATDGSEGRERVSVRFLSGASAQPLTPRLVAQRNRLLENRLLELQRRRLEMEAAHDQEVRQELQVEIERERKQARQRAEESKKLLKIEPESGLDDE